MTATVPPDDVPRANAAPQADRMPYDDGAPQGEDATLTAEIITDGKQVHVTLDVRPIHDDKVSSFVGSNILLVWDQDDPDHMRRLVNLPCDVDPATAVVSIHNGVCDMTADRRTPTDHEPVDEHDPSTHTGATA